MRPEELDEDLVESAFLGYKGFIVVNDMTDTIWDCYYSTATLAIYVAEQRAKQHDVPFIVYQFVEKVKP